MTYRVLSLFAGIGGFDLGLERTGGFKTVAFCEIEPFAVRVLNKHWPEVPVYGDVQELTAERLRADGIVPDVIVGGFPCQDISYAGKGAGLAGARSGLFFEVARLIGELGPRLVILENVAALLSRGLPEVLGTLASIGYDAEWHCIPASHVGAPHRRDRIWIMAYPTSERCGEAWKLRHNEPSERVASSGQDVADASFVNEQRKLPCKPHAQEREEQGERSFRPCGDGIGWWAVEPDVGRVAHGVPSRVDRLRCLGNAVVPQIPELIGRAILKAERSAA